MAWLKLSTEAQTLTKNLLDRPWLAVAEDGEIALGYCSAVKVLKPTPMPLIRLDEVETEAEEVVEVIVSLVLNGRRKLESM